MNAILACFDVLAVLILKRAKIAFIGQKNNNKKTSQRHLFMKYSLHGFDCCQCAVYGDVNLHSFFFSIRIYFIRISSLKFAKF